MKKLLITFQDTGICEVNINKVVKVWCNKFSISKYNDKYSLVKQGRGQRHTSVVISQEQALELIEKVKLLPIQNRMFISAITYRTKSNILSEKNRLHKIAEDKTKELSVLMEAIYEFDDALIKGEKM